jgi:hypothetical protein
MLHQQFLSISPAATMSYDRFGRFPNKLLVGQSTINLPKGQSGDNLLPMGRTERGKPAGMMGARQKMTLRPLSEAEQHELQRVAKASSERVDIAASLTPGVFSFHRSDHDWAHLA